ncbi:MAG: hypothetical protein EXS27_10150 [Pedosphaera sp.]|nr:hypothetical protein [Pedosphaera sp.]
MNNPESLIAAYLDGALSDTERAALNTWLKADAANLRRFTEAVMFEQEIRTASHATAEQRAAADFDPAIVQLNPRSRWLQWRPLAAAAAGLVLGLFCASVAWAYVAPSLGKVITLLQESFESGPAPSVTGVPIEPGRWSGDYSEIVSEQEGVKPESGKKMLRFLRGDYEGRSIPSSHSSDVFRLVDVRPYRREFADGGAVVQLTAVFNAVPFSEDENFSATLTLFALDASLVGNEMVKAENVLSTESLAFSRSSKVVMDRDPATWQKVSNELRLPPGTEFLMLRIGMSNDTKSKDKRRDSFAGHFADKVQLVIARRSEIPVP